MLLLFSVYLAAGLGSIFSHFNLPAFNLPFIVAAFTFLGAVHYSSPNDHFALKSAAPLLPNETFREADIEWEKVRIARNPYGIWGIGVVVS